MKISADLFEAFLKCSTKCWLRAAGEPGSGNTYAEWVKSQTESYRATEIERLLSEIPQDESSVAPKPANLKTDKWRLAVDVVAQASTPAGSGSVSLPGRTRTPGGTPDQPACETSSLPARPEQSLLETHLHAIERIPSAGRGRPAQFVPIRFIYRNKLTKDDRSLLAFDAFVLSQMLGREVSLGKIIHGDDHATLKVKVAALAGEVWKRIEKMAAVLASQTPPDLVLNRHCAECEFRDRCRQKAIETDDLSLLAGMSAKERQKFRSKGIFTVTQLSYTFRPRRRPKRLRDKREKYHHSLKALAIRENKIHIVGSPELKIDGTPVYLDVEGLPDRDFYYLIGLRIGNGDSAVQHSLWADTVEDEGKIWREFLAILETIEKPVLIHYGSYEKVFFKCMIDRYGGPKESSIASITITSAVNLLSFLFGQIYFPTHSNRLKDLSAILGVSRTPNVVSGIQTIAWRHEWEKLHDVGICEILLAYNKGDCEALRTLTSEMLNAITNIDSRADVDRADKPKNMVSPQAANISNEFKAILRSAYSDYSKSRVRLSKLGLVESNTTVKESRLQPTTRPKLPAVKGHIVRVPRKRKCERHVDRPTALVATKKNVERALIDVAFTTTGCKKSVLRLVGKRGRCPHCGEIYVPPAFRRVHQMSYGPGIIAWVVYLRMALRLSYRLITQASRDLIGLEIPPQTVEGFISRCASDHAKTEKKLFERIFQSPAIHVDETKFSILGQHQYIWVLTDGNRVAFQLTESRETAFLEPLVADYTGTLVSDFYGGYDALPCRQQKCLVHLIGDLNDDLWKNPFNLEFETFVASVRDILLPILADVQRFGLKACHLRKYKHRVDAFYNNAIDNCTRGHELIVKYQKRFERYRESLFTFLAHDDIPWNNNAAERALRHIAVQRKISGAFSSRGAQNYIRLLGVSQSCRFQGKSFLGFLRSDLFDVDAYKQTHSRRGQVSPKEDS